MATRPKLSDRAQKWLSIAGGVLAVGAVVYSALLATITGWADSRYVLKKELAEAVVQIGETIQSERQEASRLALASEIEDLQDDIVFFSEESNMESSVKRRCRKLPRVIQAWEEQSDTDWEEDPIVEAACREATRPTRIEE